jgi:hypothetical protein
MFISWIVGHAVWLGFAENVSAVPGIDASATRYSRTEDVGVIAIVVTELKFGNVERHILATDLVEGADNAAFHQRPETFNRVGVHGTNNVIPCSCV